jgi:hypothetical protein
MGNYPKLRCQNCETLNQLDFEPLKKWYLLPGVICWHCGFGCYWTHYFKSFGEIIRFYTFQAIKPEYLKEFVPHPFGITHGRKKPTCKSS